MAKRGTCGCGKYGELFGGLCLGCVQRSASSHRRHGDYARTSRSPAPVRNLWSRNVETHWHSPPGLFTKDAETIARVLLEESKSPGQAIRRLNFYRNRAGTNLPEARKAALRHAVQILQRKL